MDASQLPFLLQLLEDESPKVRAKVLEKLQAFGVHLDEELRRQQLHLTQRQSELLGRSASGPSLEPTKEAWLRCLELPTDPARLEAAFELIARYQSGSSARGRLGELLDGLAEGFRASARPITAENLNGYLFRDCGFVGAEADYYSPWNSNLIYVIEERRGIPMSLCCLLMLVGHRLGLEIHGCNVPGHFLARWAARGKELVFDCFSGGKILSPATLADLEKDAPPGFMEVLRTRTSALVILGRALRNLIVAYDRAEQREAGDFFRELLQETQRYQQRLAQEGWI